MITEYISSLFMPQASYKPWDNFWYDPPLTGADLRGSAGGSFAAMNVSAFFNGIRILAETVAQPPLILYERTGEDMKEKATDNPLFNVLHNQPNAYQSSYEYRLLETTNMLLGGNAYSEIGGGNRGAVEELNPLMPGYMQAKKLASRRVGYMYRDEKGNQKAYTQDEIFHRRAFPLSADGVTGQSLLTFARSTIGLSLATENYGTRLFNTDAKQRGNYSVPGSLTKEQVDAIKEIIKQSDGLMVLQNGASWVASGMTAQDAEFLLNRQFEVIEVARWLNIQPHLLKSLERCMPADTLVYTAHGPKRIIDIKVGESVWSRGPKGMRLSRVLNNWHNGIKSILKLSTTNREIRCTATHRLLVRRSIERPLVPGEIGGRNINGRKVRIEWRDEYVSAGELRVGDTLITLGQLPDQRRTIAPNGRQLTVGFMEFCGLLMGDGNIHKSNGRPSHVSIARSVSASYMPHYRDVIRQEFVKYDGGNGRGNVAHAVATSPVSLYERDRSTHFASVLAANELVALGLSGNAFTKSIPSWVFETSEDLRCAFLRGFLDADGTVDKKGRITFYSANRGLIDSVRHLCMGLGIPVTNIRSDLNTKPAPGSLLLIPTRIFRFTCSDPGQNKRIGSHDVRYQERLSGGKPFGKKNRKYPRFGGGALRGDGTALARIVAIEELPAEPVYDIEVEEDHCFIADGIVSKNSTNNNIEHQGLEFLQYTMMPYFINWEQAILRDLIVQKNRYFAEFLVDGLVRADIKTRYEAHGIAIDKGFGTRNEARVRENWNKAPGLDAFLVDQNKAIVDKSGKIIPVNKPEPAAPGRPEVRRDDTEAHYQQLLICSSRRVMHAECKEIERAWKKDKDVDKLAEWADKFYEKHGEWAADCLQIDENKARKFANDRRDRFLLSVKDNSLHDHIHETEKYGPQQLIAFLQNGHKDESREVA